MNRSFLSWLTVAFAIFAALALALLIVSRPAYLRIAVVKDSIDHSLMEAAARLLEKDRASVRLVIAPVADAASAVQSLDRGLVDLAIGPSDQTLPVSGQTAIIMRRHAVLILAPAGGKIGSIVDLAGRSIGVVDLDAPDAGLNRMLDTVLARHNLPASSVRRVPIDVASIAEAMAAGRIDAVLAAGVPGDGPLAAAVEAVARAGHGEPVFVPPGHAHALFQLTSAFEPLTIPPGVFSAPAPRPAQEFETIAYSIRLFASINLRDATVGAATRSFFMLKSRLAVQFPIALRFAAPSTNKDAALPVHPGAAAYLDGEEESFFDRFSEFFYLGAMLISIVGSAIAGAANYLGSASRRAYRAQIARLLEIWTLARLAEDLSTLRLLQVETDNIFSECVAVGARGKYDEARLNNLGLVVAQVNQALRERRSALAAGQGAADTGEPEAQVRSPPAPALRKAS